MGAPYPAFVSAADEDGNETAGIRLSEVSVPLATHTGWSTLLAEGSRWDGVAVLVGNSRPFARNDAERAAANDPRPSIDEGYPSKEAYLQHVRNAAELLVEERFMMARDVEHVVAAALDRFDAITQPTTR